MLVEHVVEEQLGIAYELVETPLGDHGVYVGIILAHLDVRYDEVLHSTSDRGMLYLPGAPPTQVCYPCPGWSS